MISLFLDTCNSNITIGLLEDTKVINSVSFTNDNKLSETLLPSIDKILKESNLTIKDLNKIFISIGPGSFTGIRIGVTVAKTIAWGFKLDIIPVSSLEVMASIDTNKRYICPLIDARRGFVYTSIYDQNLEVIYDNKYTDYSLFIEANNSILDDIEFVSYDTFDNSIIPNINIEKIVSKHYNDESVNPHSVNPIYLKLTEAEEKLNDIRN